MTGDRRWRFDQLRAGADEPPPRSGDRHEWAEWCDRKAATARLLREEALADGNDDVAQEAEHVYELALRSARRLRHGPGA
jgi:hypothetical protein